MSLTFLSQDWDEYGVADLNATCASPPVISCWNSTKRLVGPGCAKSYEVSNPHLIILTSSSSRHPHLILTSSSPHPHLIIVLILTCSSRHPHLIFSQWKREREVRFGWLTTRIKPEW